MLAARLLGFVLLLSFAFINTMPARAQAAATSAQSKLDFDAEWQRARIGFQRAKEKASPRADDLAQIVKYAELAFHHIGDDERDKLIDELADAATAFRDRPSSDILHAWSAVFDAQKSISEAMAGTDAQTSDDDKRQAMAPGYESVEQAQETIAKVPRGPNRDVLDACANSLLAIADRFTKDSDSLARRAKSFLSKPTWTAYEAPLFLSVVGVWAVNAFETANGSGDSAVEAISTLTAARARTEYYWKSHPALTIATEFVVQIAGRGALRKTGRLELSRLTAGSPGEQGWTGGPFKQAQYAFELGDFSTGLSSLVKGLNDAAKGADPNSKDWRDFVEAQLEFLLVESNSTQRLNIFTALLDDLELLPSDSPARRWLTGTAAAEFEKLGNGMVALRLRERAGQMPLSRETADLLRSTDDAGVLEKSAYALEMETNPVERARLLERAFELRKDAATLTKTDGAVVVDVLIQTKYKIGEAADIRRYIHAYREAALHEDIAAPSDDRFSIVIDRPVNEVIAGLRTVMSTLDETGTGADYIAEKLQLQEAIASITENRLKSVLQSMLSRSKKIQDVLAYAGFGVTGLIDSQGAAAAIHVYGDQIFPVLFGPAGENSLWSEYEVQLLFNQVADDLHRIGADFAAGQLHLAHKNDIGFTPRLRAESVCLDLADVPVRRPSRGGRVDVSLSV